MEMKKYKRGKIYYAHIPKGVGSEQMGYRPVIILQNDIGNKYSPTAIVASLTSSTKQKASIPTHYVLKAGDGVPKDSIVLLEQIYTIDKQRLHKYVGKPSDGSLIGIDHALAISFNLVDAVNKTADIRLCDDCMSVALQAKNIVIDIKNSPNFCFRCKKRIGKLYEIHHKECA